MTGVLVAAAIIAAPAIAFTLWPLLRPRGTSGLLAVPPDAREQLAEQKRGVLRSLRELEFEHSSGHVSDDDYADLRARYETEAAAILTDLDRIGVAPVTPPPSTPTATTSRSAWLHPAALVATGVSVLVFGVAIGVGIVRYTAPDPTAGMPVPGSRPLAEIGPASAPGVPPPGGPLPGGSATEGGTPRKLAPEMLRGMLEAARQALFAGNIRDAAAAYQAVLKRDENNVDALTHYGLIVAMAAQQHPDRGASMIDLALATFDKALAIDSNYAPALLYRGQVLYEARRDAAGAIRSWEKFIAVTPPGEDRDRVLKLIAETKSKGK